MIINWFPGHMTKSLRMMEKEIKNVDAIIYLLDARAPNSSFNPKFAELIGTKPVLYVLNKYDLADDKATNAFIEKMKKHGQTAIKLNAGKSGAGKIVEPILRKLLSEKIEKLKAKGIKLLPKAMVIGVPNVGKSTLINNLSGISKTKTGNKAGVTRGKQLITLRSGVQVIDTPGTLWPSFENQMVAVNLALVGSIKDEVVDTNEIAFKLLEYMVENYKENILQRYNIEELDEDLYEACHQIAAKRGFLLKGGDFDFDRTCKMIVTEFRKGLLGKVSLD